MKKITIIAAAAAFMAVSFTSCKKDYTCECTYTNAGLNSTSVIKTTKSDAKTKCEAISNAAKGAGGSCAIK